MTQVVNLANFSNSLDSSGGLSTSALNAPFPIDKGGTNATTVAQARTNLQLGTIATQNSSSVSITGGNVFGINDLAIADGGTGASTVAAARTNLGVAINSDVMPYVAPGASGNVLRSNGSSWTSYQLSTLIGINMGAGTVAPLSYFAATTGATGKLLVKIHAHAYATYGNFGARNAAIQDPFGTLVRIVTLRTMEWDSRVSADGGASMMYLFSGSPNTSYNWTFWTNATNVGVLENAYYSWVGT
jgi:hypothetical protein